MSNIYRIVFIDKINFETQSIGRLFVAWYFLHLFGRLEVLYVMSISVPTISSCLDVLLWIYERLHALIIRGIWLEQIDDIESVLNILSIVLNTKVIPLRHSLIEWGKVWPQLQIINEFSHLSCSSQVSRLKSGFKNQCGITGSCWSIELPKFIVVLGYLLIYMGSILFPYMSRNIQPNISVFKRLIHGIKAIIYRFGLVFVKHHGFGIQTIDMVGDHLVRQLVQLLLYIHALSRMNWSLQQESLINTCVWLHCPILIFEQFQVHVIVIRHAHVYCWFVGDVGDKSVLNSSGKWLRCFRQTLSCHFEVVAFLLSSLLLKLRRMLGSIALVLRLAWHLLQLAFHLIDGVMLGLLYNCIRNPISCQNLFLLHPLPPAADRRPKPRSCIFNVLVESKLILNLKGFSILQMRCLRWILHFVHISHNLTCWHQRLLWLMWFIIVDVRPFPEFAYQLASSTDSVGCWYSFAFHFIKLTIFKGLTAALSIGVPGLCGLAIH